MKTTNQKATSIEFPMQGEKNTARYVSDLMVREEALENGMLRGLYWSSSGQVSRWIPEYDHALHAPSTAFELEIDGHDLSGHWNWQACLRKGWQAGDPGGRNRTQAPGSACNRQGRHTPRRHAGDGPIS